MKNIVINKESLCCIGDIHGEFAEIVFKISQAGIKDTGFILLGDCGLGFNSPGWIEDVYRRKLKKRLESSGNILYCFRGNHDDPEYYKEGGLIDFPGLVTIPDYSRLKWKDREILVIGGGVSVDRECRLTEEKKSKKPIKIWWPGERITQDLEALKPKEDIIVSHMSPLCFGPILTRHPKMAHEDWEADKADREYLSTVFKETSPERWYFGHYHTSLSGDLSGCLWRGLGINEIIEVNEKIY